MSSMKKILIILSLILNYHSYSQSKYNPLSKPDTYKNTDNPNYWKNKMPHKNYWQQDVYYDIKADIDEITDIISGHLKLVYTNNSPDQLDYVYFHLYQNAFQPESYLDELQRQNNKYPNYGIYESQKLGTVIEKINVNNEHVKTELDNTILKVYLPKTLNKNESITFEIKFKSHFDAGDVRRRMTVFDAWGNKHYNGVHWYPRICVYDAKFGWTKDQHLGKEFYGNFGTFDVQLTFASNFIVEATGFLTNRKEVLPNDLREKLDIKNFKDKPWNEPPSTIIPYKKEERKTWIFHAENVHDFAFTADPTYRIGEAYWKDKVCYSLVQEPHASKWQNAAEFGAKCLKIFSEDFGMYVYHKVIVADAKSGMEYPMITLDGGYDPGYRDLLAHEIGHMWFFGQVGNNETYRALLDEGFTQFLTAWAMIKIDGEEMIELRSKNKWKKKYKRPIRAIDSEIYNSYINDATKYNDPVISTHSDGFNGALRHGGGYRHVYYKTAAMLYNLQYVLGDELFLDAMKNYFNTWKIAHPYNEDFKKSFIQFTKVDLNWFFDQWLDTKKRIDYSVKVKENDIIFKRKSRMQMPIDFRVIANNGKHFDYHIPNNWFIKKTNATVLPKWHGWDLIHPTYKTTLNIPLGIKEVIIDPSNRLADAYMPDNKSNYNYTFKFNPLFYEFPDWRNYEVKYHPNIWWNRYDGIKVGFNLDGGYMNHHHLFETKVWINTSYLNEKNILNNRNELLNYDFKYKTNLDKLSLKSKLQLQTKYNLGQIKNKIAIEKIDNKKNRISLNIISYYRLNNRYLPMYDLDNRMLNNRIDIEISHKYKYKYGNGNINLCLQSSAVGSDYDYNKIILKINNQNKVNNLKIKTRAFVQIGTGTNWPTESKLFLSGSSPEEMLNSANSKLIGIIPEKYLENSYSYNNFHSSGGLNLRGYTGYFSPEFNYQGKIISLNNSGISGASINTEISFSSFMLRRILGNKINTYFFADAGTITNENISKSNYKDIFIDLRADAGIGFTYSFSNFGSLEKIKPIVLRLDLPLFLNRPPGTDDDFVKFRWLFGINTVL